MTRLLRRNSLTLLFVAAIVIAATAVAQAQVRRSGILSSDVTKRYGLKLRWVTQVELDRSTSRVVGVTHFVSPTRFHVVYEVQYDDRTIDFSERTLDAFKKPWGRESAKQRAEIYKDKLVKLGNKEEDVEINERVIPESTLYVTTDHAVIHAINAENGQTLWARPVGRHDHPTLTPAASDNFVAVINGSYLYILNSYDGKLVWSRQLGGAPGAGPALTDERVFVPMVNGKMESYSLEDTSEPLHYFQSHGRTLVQPVTSPISVAWPSDRGFLYVANANTKGTRYRMEALANIVSQPAIQAPGRIFVASLDGYVYAVNELDGKMLWQYSTGEPVSQSPVALGDFVYVVSDDFGLYCITADKGETAWWAPGIKRFLAASEGRVYAIGETDQMLILDRESGGIIGAMPMGTLNLKVPNTLTDRIFVGSHIGVLQCLHEPQNEKPVVHLPTEPTEPERPEIKQDPAGAEGAQPDAKPKPADPFGGGADPFGGGADPFGGGGAKPKPSADPFGGGADPFGGGGADPFGGGNDNGAAKPNNDLDPFGGPSPFDQ